MSGWLRDGRYQGIHRATTVHPPLDLQILSRRRARDSLARATTFGDARIRLNHGPRPPRPAGPPSAFWAQQEPPHKLCNPGSRDGNTSLGGTIPPLRLIPGQGDRSLANFVGRQ